MAASAVEMTRLRARSDGLGHDPHQGAAPIAGIDLRPHGAELAQPVDGGRDVALRDSRSGR